MCERVSKPNKKSLAPGSCVPTYDAAHLGGGAVRGQHAQEAHETAQGEVVGGRQSSEDGTVVPRLERRIGH